MCVLTSSTTKRDVCFQLKKNFLQGKLVLISLEKLIMFCWCEASNRRCPLKNLRLVWPVIWKMWFAYNIPMEMYRSNKKTNTHLGDLFAWIQYYVIFEKLNIFVLFGKPYRFEPRIIMHDYLMDVISFKQDKKNIWFLI